MKLIVISISLLFSIGTTAQSDYHSKVSSIDSIVYHLYNVISGDKSIERDWELFKHLFTEDAKLMPVSATKDGKMRVSYLSPQDYIDRSGAWLVENGFHEKEIHRVTERFGNIVHLFSTYAAFRSSSDIEPFMRGINSIQLLYDNNRWWITNIYWQAESNDHPLPKKYLE